jgi:hypothetical protein
MAEQQYIYLVGLGVGHNKLGCTSQRNPWDRLHRYPKDSTTILRLYNVTGLGALSDIEKRCKQRLCTLFGRHENGHEHFVGDGMEMARHVDAVIREYTDISNGRRSQAIEDFVQAVIREAGAPDWIPKKDVMVRGLKAHFRAHNVVDTATPEELATALEPWLGKLNALRTEFLWNNENREAVKRVIQAIKQEDAHDAALLKQLESPTFTNRVLRHLDQKEASEEAVSRVVCELLRYTRRQERERRDSQAYSEFIRSNIIDGAKLTLDQAWEQFRFWCRMNYSWTKPSKPELKKQLIKELGDPTARYAWMGKRLRTMKD